MKPKVAVHKFASCDGCQLALLNAGPDLLALAERVDFVHFAEAGIVAPEAEADIALVEGSVSTPEEAARIRTVRERSRYLVTIGACATAGGLQALRNGADAGAWVAGVYAHPEWIEISPRALPVAEFVKVDHELRGCPVSTRQVLALFHDLLRGVAPRPVESSVCLACKRAGHACVTVTQGEPCLGPVTQDGCGALCPGRGRGCYGCYGPAATVNAEGLIRHWTAQGMDKDAVRRRFRFITPEAPAFRTAAEEGGE
ncbi:MAG: sulfhydrogenase subunit delta [Gammaproteobacteria bacterium]|nr:MAG: sulfhydrogenase subunit delta [Gammaproteobacteria bacterium]